MLKSFERRLTVKFDELKCSSGADTAVGGSIEDGKACSTLGSGHWYHWAGQDRRVPHEYEFPNKMPLKSTWLRYFVPDQVNSVYPMRYFTDEDLKNIKVGRRNLSA